MAAALAASPPAVLSNQQGEFLLVGLSPGRYDLAADGAGVVGQLSGVEAGAVNVSIHAQHAENVSAAGERGDALATPP
jgi:hypothetical protein